MIYFKNVLVVTDNGVQYQRFLDLLRNQFPDVEKSFHFKRSGSVETLTTGMYANGINDLQPCNVKRDWPSLAQEYDLIISLHCKQIFPSELVNRVKCINIHPGFNPLNRGWYPQVFALYHNHHVGATIHEMDELVDNGAIIDQAYVQVEEYDTSKDVYERILCLEISLLRENLMKILGNVYQTFQPAGEANYYSMKDFNRICHIDMDEKISARDFINRLRALSHGDCANAYYTNDSGEKIFITVNLKKK
tara:strand:- start:36 stop:782 length:747 start_codon:yes stop_codon:yes gene_type:complete